MLSEKEQILNHNQGEIPIGEYDILRIKDIPNPEQELNTFKQTVIAFLEHRDLNKKDPKWRQILPTALVKFTEQLKEEDFHKDDIIYNIQSIIDTLQEVKDWEWYSSRLTPNGFDVYMKGMFRGIFLPMIHQQGIPHTSLFIIRDGKEYPTYALTDVLTYRKWNPNTLKLT
ncbi:MAG: hypothetical protein NTW29_14245 [Bacteroidetes bacterium]|nr:hypothetical protein [Bacteroidota bacterium]